MFDTLMHNKVAVGVVALLLAGSAWYVLGGGGGQTDMLVTEDFATPASETDKDLVATLLQLRSVTLDGTIFSDSSFQSLRDFGSQIVPEPVGRPNPFAPLGTTDTSTKSLPSTSKR